MIKNERQYKFTKTQVERFERTLAELRSRRPEDTDLHPLVAKAQEDAVSGQIVDLKEELQIYESMKAGTFPLDQLEVVSELSKMLIGARIAQGISQKELAERIGLKEQQIQRYEATDYASASLSRIREIVGGLSRKTTRSIGSSDVELGY
ncbi:MAG: helix-turn-helix transcriptional regulator [Dehalococcoidia bacterium]|nr:helix-turn-helix transcriptional regulator [Dehalococcoidia bacterium]